MERYVEIAVLDPGAASSGRSTDGWIADAAKAVMLTAVGSELGDDRFDGEWPPTDLLAAVASSDGAPIGYLGGTVDRGRLQLDGLVAASTLGQPEAGAILARLFRSLQPAIEASGATTVELWGKPAEAYHAALAETEGFVELRALHQLRCTLPIESPALDTRPFVVGQDEDRLVRVNNRAFATHPDQGGMTVAGLRSAQAEPWFEPDGIRLFDDPDDPELLAGFCWTKIHEPRAEGQPRLGEIYAIGIDPDHHGRGLGKPMTAAGLAWLAGRGLTTGMLYVEADNEPALRTYEKLGFEHHRTDRAWHKPLTPTTAEGST